MNCKWSVLGVHQFYNIEEALELLTNMSDCEDESTSESENEGDFSDSSEDAPGQHQVRTDSNILMPKETKVSNAKEIPKNGQKAVPKLVDNQSAIKCALLADQTATTSGEEHGASPPKVSKAKEILVPQRPWHLIVIWMKRTIMLLKMPMRVLLPNMCLA